MEGAERGKGYNAVRGASVIAYARHFLDEAAPLAQGRHADVSGFAVDAGALTISLSGGAKTTLKDPSQFAGYQGAAAAPSLVLLRNHGLHIEIKIDKSSVIGRD